MPLERPHLPRAAKIRATLCPPMGCPHRPGDGEFDALCFKRQALSLWDLHAPRLEGARLPASCGYGVAAQGNREQRRRFSGVVSGHLYPCANPNIPRRCRAPHGSSKVKGQLDPPTRSLLIVLCHDSVRNLRASEFSGKQADLQFRSAETGLNSSGFGAGARGWKFTRTHPPKR